MCLGRAVLRKDTLCDSAILQQRWAAQGSGQDSPHAVPWVLLTCPHTHKQPFSAAASFPCLPTMTSRPCKHFHLTTCYVTAWLTVKSQEYNWGNKHHLAKAGSSRHLCVAIHSPSLSWLWQPQCMRFSVVGLTWCTEEAMGRAEAVCFCSSLCTPLFFLVTSGGGCWWLSAMPGASAFWQRCWESEEMLTSSCRLQWRLIKCQIFSQSTAVWSRFVCSWGTQAMLCRLPGSQGLLQVWAADSVNRAFVSFRAGSQDVLVCLNTVHKPRLSHECRGAYQIIAFRLWAKCAMPNVNINLYTE